MQMKLKSGRWLEELRRRREALQYSPGVAGRLRVSPDLAWWYYQEFGAGTHATMPGQGDAPRDGEGRYLIKPVDAKALSFPGEGGLPITVPLVWHPGYEDKHFVQDALLSIKEDFAETIIPLVANGQIAQAQEILLSAVMTRALTAIQANIADKLRGTRSDGRLHGESAADAFLLGAEVVNPL